MLKNANMLNILLIWELFMKRDFWWLVFLAFHIYFPEKLSWTSVNTGLYADFWKRGCKFKGFYKGGANL